MNKDKVFHVDSDLILKIVVMTLLIALLFVVAYPLIYVISSSFSSGRAVTSGQVYLFPVQVSVEGYTTVFAYKRVWVGYANTVFYAVVGTAINIVMTTMCAYALSRRNLQFKRFYSILFLIPMFFGGGLIPTYINIGKLGMINTRWAILIPGAISIYNMIIMRTFFQNSIPNELLEAAKIDGITDAGYLWRVVIPLSKAIYAVITLCYIVGHWNSYFSAMIYLRDTSKQPLQLVMRSILNANQISLQDFTDPEALAGLVGRADVMKFSLMVLASAPMLVLYSFVQKFFEKGVMIGSVKG